MVCGDQCGDVSTVRRWVRWSVQWGNGLWWSVCWCEYSKVLGKVKSAVRKWFQKQNTNFFKDEFQNLEQRWRNCIEILVILWKNNNAALKIIDVSIFRFYIPFKYLFPFIFCFNGGKSFQPAPVSLLDLNRELVHRYVYCEMSLRNTWWVCSVEVSGNARGTAGTRTLWVGPNLYQPCLSIFDSVKKRRSLVSAKPLKSRDVRCSLARTRAQPTASSACRRQRPTAWRFAAMWSKQ